MSGIVLAARWDGAPLDPQAIPLALAAIADRGPDRRDERVRGSVGLGHALLAVRPIERSWRQPAVHPALDIAAVSDATLYNRTELIGSLAGPCAWLGPQPSDTELVLAAYEAWGDAAPARLDGDFAFAIWDGRTRRVFAARDAFGVRPLFYHRGAGALWLASEPKQILAGASLAAVPSEIAVGEHLLELGQEASPSFWDGIDRVRPGHALVADSEGLAERRWWVVDPTREIAGLGHAEIADAIRERLRHAVAKRLDADGPVAIQLSGGLDSSSVATLADDAKSAPGDLLLLTRSYPGFACDESAPARDVAQRIAGRHVVMPVSGEDILQGLSDELWGGDGPLCDMQRAGARLDAAAMRSAGSRVLLTGVGGDEVFTAWEFLPDLAARGRLLRLVREARAISPASYWSAWKLATSPIRQTAPGWIKSAARSFRSAADADPLAGFPAWMNAEFAARFHALPDSAPLDVPPFRSRTQSSVFRAVQHPYLFRWLETHGARAARAGYETRFPMLDRTLVELVLSIPFHLRTLAGWWKALLRDSLGDRLPPSVRDRRRKVVYDEYLVAAVQQALPAWSALAAGPDRWCSSGFVDRDAAATLIGRAHRDGIRSYHEARTLWNVACTELWLRVNREHRVHFS